MQKFFMIGFLIKFVIFGNLIKYIIITKEYKF